MKVFQLRRFTVTFVLSIALLLGASVPAAGSAQSVPRHLAGYLLVATRAMGDPHFARSVIFIISDTARGAMGVVVNRVEGKVALAALLKDAGADPDGAHGTVAVHYGGPVKPATGILLHSTDYSGKNTLRINSHYAITGGTKVLRAIGTGKGPRKRMFALGYAGWGVHQLRREIRAGAWSIVKASDEFVFSKHPETVWQRAIKRRIYSL